MNVNKAAYSKTYPSLKIDSPTLVEPEVLPRGTSDQVATPAMCKLMCNHIDILSILVSLVSQGYCIIVLTSQPSTFDIMLGVQYVYVGFSIPAGFS
jgi:hypothetical protein